MHLSWKEVEFVPGSELEVRTLTTFTGSPRCLDSSLHLSAKSGVPSGRKAKPASVLLYDTCSKNVISLGPGGLEAARTDVEIELSLFHENLCLLSLVWLVALLDNVTGDTSSRRTAWPRVADIA